MEEHNPPSDSSQETKKASRRRSLVGPRATSGIGQASLTDEVVFLIIFKNESGDKKKRLKDIEKAILEFNERGKLSCRITPKAAKWLHSELKKDSSWLSRKNTKEPGVLLCTTQRPMLLRKWAMAQQLRLKSLGENKPPEWADKSIDELYVSHDGKLHGEGAHTLRMLIRGGQVDVDYIAKANNDLQNSWKELLTWVGKLQRGDEFELTEVKSLTKIGHASAHLAQVPDDPQAFCNQLEQELNFPKLIKKTREYKDIEKEVKTLLSNNKFDVIMWVREKKKGENRDLVEFMHYPYIMEGGREAACKATGKKTASILILGDKIKSEDLELKKKAGDQDLRGVHLHNMRGEMRSQLEQLLFLVAVGQVSGANLVVGERSGLVDKVALTMGIACCQLSERNVSRLDEVLVTGCSMGRHMERKGKSRSEILELVREKGWEAILEFQKLKTAILNRKAKVQSSSGQENDSQVDNSNND